MADFGELSDVASADATIRSPAAHPALAWSRTVTSRNFEFLRPSGRVRQIGPQPTPGEAPRAVATNPPEWGGEPVGSIPDEYVVFENVFVTEQGAVVEGDNLFLEDALFHRKDFEGIDPEWLQRHLRSYDATPTPHGTVISSRRPPVKRPGTLFLLTHLNPHNFGHFVHDLLARFYIFDHLPRKLRDEAALLCSPHPHPMQRLLVDGFRGDHRIATIEPGTVWQVERVIMPRNPISSRAVSAHALRYARQRMQQIAGADRPPA